MQKTEADLAATVQRWLEKAKALHAREDVEWGRDGRGDGGYGVGHGQAAHRLAKIQ